MSEETLLGTSTCELIVGLVVITQMLNEVGSTEKYVTGVSKIHDGQSISTNLLFSDFIISSLIVNILGMSSSALDHIQIVEYEINPAHLSLSMSEPGNQKFHRFLFYFL
jgi:hypothetical protein